MVRQLTQFYVEVNNITDEERDWMDKNLLPYKDRAEDCDENTFCNLWGIGDEDCWPMFCDEYKNDRFVQFYSNKNNSNAENLAKFLLEFIRKFRPDQCIGFEIVCHVLMDKQPDRFSGGAYFITKEGISSLSVQRWLEEQEELFSSNSERKQTNES